MDEALTELAKLDERASRVVELRFFGGHTDKEVCEILGEKLPTVRRDWVFARSWLKTRFQPAPRCMTPGRLLPAARAVRPGDGLAAWRAARRSSTANTPPERSASRRVAGDGRGGRRQPFPRDAPLARRAPGRGRRPSRAAAFQIGNYKILRELGRGGMGVVYLALRNDDVFHKIVALKVIGGGGAPPRRISSSDSSRSGRSSPASIIPTSRGILDGGNTEDGRPFYVMEYVAGSPIDEYCSRVSADVPARVRMIADVCEAVEYLHAHAIAHRDIKPNNILVTPEGRVKLVDFGVAKVDTVDGLVASPSSPGQATMIMTPGYASPEQIAGDPSGKSGDIYSLAVVLYQLLTGPASVRGRRRTAESGGAAVGRGPEASEQGSRRAARSREPQRRLETHEPSRSRSRRADGAATRSDCGATARVQLFAEDLRRCLDGRPIVARPESSAYRFRKLVSATGSRPRWPALLIVSACAGAWMAVSVRIERAQLEAKEAEVERFVALLNAKVARWLEPSRRCPSLKKSPTCNRPTGSWRPTPCAPCLCRFPIRSD